VVRVNNSVNSVNSFVKMSDDLTKYEIDQINRVDAKLSETKQKTNQAAARFEEKFKQPIFGSNYLQGKILLPF